MRTFPARSIARLAVLGVAALVVAAMLSGAARAHEHRTAGGHELVVGFQNEPSYVNEPNGIWLSVHEAAPAGAAGGEGAPVEGLEKTLEAEVIQGNERMDVPLRAAFGEPGVYLGEFIPTRVGDYSFRFTGTIGGQPVDERFDSGPGRFSSVEDTAELQFPVQQPSAQALQASVAEARGAASQARTFGLAGIGVGVLGLLTAGAALLSRRGRPAAAPVARSERVQG